MGAPSEGGQSGGPANGPRRNLLSKKEQKREEYKKAKNLPQNDSLELSEHDAKMLEYTLKV